MYNCAVGNPQTSGFYTFETLGILADSEEGASVGELNSRVNWIMSWNWTDQIYLHNLQGFSWWVFVFRYEQCLRFRSANRCETSLVSFRGTLISRFLNLHFHLNLNSFLKKLIRKEGAPMYKVLQYLPATRHTSKIFLCTSWELN